MATCSAIKADGERCKGIARAGSEWCPANDPARSEARRRAASKAGKARPSRDLADVKAQLRQLADQVLEGTVDKSRAAVAGQLYNTLIRAVSVELKAKEVEELEQRISELERIAS